MTRMQKAMMRRFFREADGDPARLPWHSEEASPFLAQALGARPAPRRALDVGCGSGNFAARMAELGLKVTAIDYLPEAIAMARQLTARRGVLVELIETDVLRYQPERPFSLVFDSGCLHNMSGRELIDYRNQLSHLLAPGGDYLLGHWGRRHAMDWRPFGPRRRRPTQLERILGPQLELVDFEESDEHVPLPFGPWVRMASYWFQRRRG